MKKIFTAAIGLLLAVALTACGGGSADGETAEETVSVTSGDSLGETAETEKTETEKKSQAETVPQNEDDEAAEDDEEIYDKDDDPTEINIETEEFDEAANTFYGTGYSLTVDPKTWLNYTEYMTDIIQSAENVDVGIKLTEEELQKMGDCVFMHSVGTGTNFNVTVNEVGAVDPDFDLSLIGDLMEEQFTQSGVKYLSDEVVTVNGHKALKLQIEMTDAASGKKVNALQYIFYNGVNQYGFTYTADTDTYDSCLADFETVLNTVSFE